MRGAAEMLFTNASPKRIPGPPHIFFIFIFFLESE